MTISLPEVEKIAKLARIRFDNAESVRMQTQLEGVFNWIDQLNEIDVSAVDLNAFPAAQMHERDDVVTTPNQVKDVIQNAPQAVHDMYAVPKVVE